MSFKCWQVTGGPFREGTWLCRRGMASRREKHIGGRWSERSGLLGFREERKPVRWQWPWSAFECTASLVCTILSLSQGEERLGNGSGLVEFVIWDVALWISDLLFHLGKEMPR